MVLGMKPHNCLYIHSISNTTESQMKNCAMKFDTPSIMITECNIMLFQESSPDLFTLAMYTITWVVVTMMMNWMIPVISNATMMITMMVKMVTTMMAVTVLKIPGAKLFR